MTMTNFTGGRNRTLKARVYDRLRKRSLRAIREKTEHEVTHRASASDWTLWNESLHEAYVAGVRDALNALERGDG